MAVSLPPSCKNLSLLDFAEHFHTNTQRRGHPVNFIQLRATVQASRQEQAVMNREERKFNRTHALLLLLNERLRTCTWFRALNTVITGLLGLHQLNAPCRTKLFHFLPLALFGARGHRLYTPEDSWKVSISSKTDRWGNHETRKAPSLPTSPRLSPAFFWCEAGEEGKRPPTVQERTGHLVTFTLTSTISYPRQQRN